MFLVLLLSMSQLLLPAETHFPAFAIRFPTKSNRLLFMLIRKKKYLNRQRQGVGDSRLTSKKRQHRNIVIPPPLIFCRCFQNKAVLTAIHFYLAAITCSFQSMRIGCCGNHAVRRGSWMRCGHCRRPFPPPTINKCVTTSDENGVPGRCRGRPPANPPVPARLADTPARRTGYPASCHNAGATPPAPPTACSRCRAYAGC